MEAPLSSVGEEPQRASPGDLTTPSRTLPQKFTSLYLECRVPLRAYLHVFLRDEAAIDDCLQETAILVWQKIREDWTVEDFRRMAFASARFKALSWLKKNRPGTLLFYDSEVITTLAARVMEDSRSGGSEAESRILGLRHCLGILAPEQREIIHARYNPEAEKGLSELAGKRQRGIASLYKQLERLRSLLRDCVERWTRKEEP